MADLDAVHDRLRSMLRRHANGFHVAADSGAGMTLELPGYEGKPWGYVAGTRLGKRYVSYYLMSVYARPELVASMSPELRRRMQGKSCFNFATIDEGLLRELEGLTERVLPGHAAVVGEALAAKPRR
jgi:hypothetical protein